MDKMLVDDGGDVVVTNDGVTLLEEMDIDHPAAEMVVEVAETQEAEVGDGTTSAVVLAGELLSVAEDLVERGVHPSSIVSGYRHAAGVADDLLAELATTVDADDTETLERIAGTAMTGKGAENAREHLAGLVVEAVRAGVREDGSVDRDAVSVASFPGGALADSRFVHGAMVDKSPPHDDMPRSLRDAKVLVYEGGIEVSELSADANATVSDFDEVTALVERERGELRDAVDCIVDAGANVVLTEGGINDRAQALLANEGVLALRRVDDEDRRRVVAATGATPVGDLENLSPENLGAAGRVEQEQIRQFGYTAKAEPERTIVFDDVAAGESGTVLLRGGTEHVLEEVERAVEDSIGVVVAALEDGTVLPGAGAPEMELSLALREEADSLDGREQLAVEAFADALEAGPRTLAENAGGDPIDAMVELKAAHDRGERAAGLDEEAGETVDALDAGVVEPLRVKRTAVGSATEAATMILRIDDIVTADDLSTGGN